MLVAHGGEANPFRFAPSHSLKNFVWRGTALYLNHATSFFLKGSRPSPLPPIPFLNSPRRKIRMETSGKARGRHERYSARGGIQRVATQSSVPCSFKLPRTRSVRSGFAQSVGLDHKIELRVWNVFCTGVYDNLWNSSSSLLLCG